MAYTPEYPANVTLLSKKPTILNGMVAQWNFEVQLELNGFVQKYIQSKRVSYPFTRAESDFTDEEILEMRDVDPINRVFDIVYKRNVLGEAYVDPTPPQEPTP